MNLHDKSILTRALSAGWFALAAGLAQPAQAQAWPNKPIRILIAQAPGSATDFISRVVSVRLAENLGQTIHIEARPGAGGALGTEAAARAAADGYTLFMGNNSTHGSNPALYAKLPYDAVNDFAPIAFVASVPYALLVDASLPVRNVKDLLALAKSVPGKLNYASAGIGSTHHLSGELLKSLAGIDVVHIPYKGTGPAITALLAGEVSYMFTNAADIQAHIKSGKLRAIAVSSAKRSNHLPDLPSLAQEGVTGFDITSWFGLLAPAGTPPAVISRLNTEMQQVLGRADVKTTLGAQGLEVVPGSAVQFAEHIKSEIARFTKIAKSAAIKAE